MKRKMSLIKISKINSRVTLCSNIILSLMTAGYTYAVLSLPEEERNVLLALAIPLLIVTLVVVKIIAHNINILCIRKYYTQQTEDSEILDELFFKGDVSNIDDINHLKNDITKIISQYER